MAGSFIGLPGMGEGLPGVPPVPGLGAAAPVVPAAVSSVHDGVVSGSLEGVATAVDEAADLREALRVAAAALNAAGVESPRADAELLAGHVLGEDRGRVAVLALMGAPVPEGYGALVAARAARIPLQHLTGGAPFRQLSLAVGPGVFVPRPETELVAQAAIDEAAAVLGAGRAPLVVDACTGTGAIAAAVATEVPGSRVHAIELHEAALAYAAKNLGALTGAAVELHHADALSALGELAGSVDVFVSNPPYVPQREHGDPEVQLHDPDTALYGGGADGMDFPRALAERAALMLRPGGLFVMEHDETQEAAILALFAREAAGDRAAGAPTDVSALAGAADGVPAVIGAPTDGGPGDVRAAGPRAASPGTEGSTREAGSPWWDSAEVRRDLTGRPRFVVARRSAKPHPNAADAPMPHPGVGPSVGNTAAPSTQPLSSVEESAS